MDQDLDVSRPEKQQARRGAEPRLRGSGEAVVFSAAALVGLAHALDDAFWHRGPGLGLGQHALAGAIAVAAAAAGIALFPRLRPGLRAGLAFLLGAPALVNGATHVINLVQ